MSKDNQFLGFVDQFVSHKNSPDVKTKLNQLVQFFSYYESDISLNALNTALEQFSQVCRESFTLSLQPFLWLISGTFVEHGADANLVLNSLLYTLYAYYQTAEEDPEENEEMIESRLEMLFPACGTIICSATDGVQRAASYMREQSLRELALKYRFSCFSYFKMIHALLFTLFEEPLLVIEMFSMTAYRFRISGLAVNWDLHALLRHTLSEYLDEHRVPPLDPLELSVFDGSGPQAIAGSMMGIWDMKHWTALAPNIYTEEEEEEEEEKGNKSMTIRDVTNESLDSHRNHWVWGEGVPHDIAKFPGLGRVLILDTPSYQRGWSINRVFDGMGGRVELKEILSKEETEHIVNRLKSADTDLIKETYKWIENTLK